MTPKEAEKIINPPVPYLDKKDHELAAYRFMLETVIDHSFEMAYSVEEGKNLDPGGWAKTLYKLMDEFDWELSAFDPTEVEEFKKLQQFLDSSHGGDCTAVAASCERCYVEKFYKIDTAPKSKHIGSEAFHILWREREKKKNDTNTPKR